jgi:hypothetical protein
MAGNKLGRGEPEYGKQKIEETEEVPRSHSTLTWVKGRVRLAVERMTLKR